MEESTKLHATFYIRTTNNVISYLKHKGDFSESVLMSLNPFIPIHTHTWLTLHICALSIGLFTYVDRPRPFSQEENTSLCCWKPIVENTVFLICIKACTLKLREHILMPHKINLAISTPFLYMLGLCLPWPPIQNSSDVYRITFKKSPKKSKCILANSSYTYSFPHATSFLEFILAGWQPLPAISR